RDAELLGEAAAAFLGDEHGTRSWQALDPSDVEQPSSERSAERAAEVVDLLAPVAAVPDRRARPGQRLLDIDAEAGELVGARVGEPIIEVAPDGRRAVFARPVTLVVAVAAAQRAL